MKRKSLTLVFGAALVAVAGGSIVAQIPAGSALGIERSMQKSISVAQHGLVFMRGDVELALGTATLYADEVECRVTPPEMLLRGNVWIRVSPVPTVEAKTVNRTADGVVQYRGGVKIAVGTAGTAVFADEADVRAAANEVKVRGNVTFKKLTPKK
jgi:lipopolysaccharide export system protein LptA